MAEKNLFGTRAKIWCLLRVTITKALTLLQNILETSEGYLFDCNPLIWCQRHSITFRSIAKTLKTQTLIDNRLWSWKWLSEWGASDLIHLDWLNMLFVWYITKPNHQNDRIWANILGHSTWWNISRTGSKSSCVSIFIMFTARRFVRVIKLKENLWMDVIFEKIFSRIMWFHS